MCRLRTIIRVYYYRLRMVDKDGKFRYSKVLAANYVSRNEGLSLFPNPAKTFVTITGKSSQSIMITNASGHLMKQIRDFDGNQTIDIGEWKPGVYFLKTEAAVHKFIKY